MANTDWHATSLRMALFPQQALPLTADVFGAFVGAEPDVQEDRPKEGIRRQVGKIDTAQLTATITPVMIDFVLSPLPLTAENVMGDLSSLRIGELKAELAKFEKRILTWLPKWEVPTTRVSLLVQARASASSKEGAYEILKNNLSSVSVNPKEMSDLIYRVNWKAKTELLPEGYFNRLTTWAAINLKVTGSLSQENQVTVRDQNFAQVDMDINSPSERTEALPKDKISTIYAEFFHLAANIADSGEG